MTDVEPINGCLEAVKGFSGMAWWFGAAIGFIGGWIMRTVHVFFKKKEDV